VIGGAVAMNGRSKGEQANAGILRAPEAASGDDAFVDEKNLLLRWLEGTMGGYAGAERLEL